MEVSGEVADLVVKEGLQVTEAAVKLAGKGIVSATALLLALAKEDHKLIGKTSIKRMAKEGGEAVVIPLKSQDLKQFDKLAKQYGVLYVAVKKKGENSGVLDIVSTVNYSAQLNTVLAAMGYARPAKATEEESPKKAKTCAPQEKSSNERRNGSTPLPTDMTSKKPSVRRRLEALQQASESMNKAPVRQPEKTR